MIWWVVLFLFAGMALVFSEFFLPGAILGILGVVLVIISAALGIYAYPDYGFFIVVAEIIGMGACLLLGYLVLTKTRAAKLLTQQHVQLADAGYVSAESDLSLLDQEGTVLTALRPAGTVKVGDKRVDAVSKGVFIDEGVRVRIVEVRGSRVVAEPVETE